MSPCLVGYFHSLCRTHGCTVYTHTPKKELVTVIIARANRIARTRSIAMHTAHRCAPFAMISAWENIHFPFYPGAIQQQHIFKKFHCEKRFNSAACILWHVHDGKISPRHIHSLYKQVSFYFITFHSFRFVSFLGVVYFRIFLRRIDLPMPISNP